VDVSRGNLDSPSIAAAIEFLNRAPVDEVYTLNHLAAGIYFSPNSLEGYVPMPAFERYRVKCSRRFLYGNPLAVRKLRRSLENR
jgi:hypothetical protein